MRGAAGVDAFEDFALGIGDGFDGAEIFEMRRRDGGDDGHMRAHLLRPARGFRRRDSCRSRTRRNRGVARHAREAQRHAPMIVVGGRRCRDLARGRESASRSISLVVVLPALPVTATTRGLACARATRGRGPPALLAYRRHYKQRRIGRRRLRARGRPARPPRPCRAPAATNSWPSALRPCSATNRSPFFERARVDGNAGRRPSAVSLARRLRRRHPWRSTAALMPRLRPVRVAAAIAWSRSENGCTRCRPRSGLPRGPCRQSPARRPRRARQRRCGWPGRGRRFRARRAAGAQNFAADRTRRLRIRGLSSVTMTRSAACGGRRAHQRTLAAVAIAAAAEHDMDVSGHMRAQRLEHRVERIGRVRVIDIESARRISRAPPSSMRPGRALQRFQRTENPIGGMAQHEAQPGRDQRVGCLKGADQRQRDQIFAAFIVDAQALAVRSGSASEEAEI